MLKKIIVSLLCLMTAAGALECYGPEQAIIESDVQALQKALRYTDLNEQDRLHLLDLAQNVIYNRSNDLLIVKNKTGWVYFWSAYVHYHAVLGTLIAGIGFVGETIDGRKDAPLLLAITLACGLVSYGTWKFENDAYYNRVKLHSDLYEQALRIKQMLTHDSSSKKKKL